MGGGWTVDYAAIVLRLREEVASDWEAAVLKEVRDFPDRPIEQLAVLQACVLDGLGPVQTGSDTESRPEHFKLHKVEVENGVDWEVAPFPDTNVPTQTASGDRPRPVPAAGIRLSLHDILMPPSDTDPGPHARISAWMAAATAYVGALVCGARPPPKPKDLVITEEDLLRPEFRGVVWNTEDPTNVFPRQPVNPMDAASPDPAVHARLHWLAARAGPNYPDQALLSRIREGFTLECTQDPSRTSYFCCPHGSFAQHAARTNEELTKQLDEGWCSVHDFPASLPAKLAPQGSVVKPRSEKRRRTSDWTFNPRGENGISPNDAVDSNLLPPLHFSSTATYARALAVLRAGAGGDPVLQAGVDVAHAYSNLALLESELWQSQYVSALGAVTERRVPFGGRFAPNVYGRFSDLTVHIMREAMDRVETRSPLSTGAGLQGHWAKRSAVSAEHGRRYFISAYLDDYSAAAIGQARTLRASMVVCAVLATSRLNLSAKSQGPASFSRHLGLWFCSDIGAVMCPDDKRDHLVQQARTVIHDDDGTRRATIVQKDLRSLAHGLHFVTPCHPRLRGRLGAMFRLSHKATRHGTIKSSDRIVHDAECAIRYLREGSAAPLKFIAERSCTNGGMTSLKGSTIERFADFSTDAAGHVGGRVAAYHLGTWCAWQPSHRHLEWLSIGALEFLGLACGLVAFKADLSGTCIRALNDNASVVIGCNNLSARHPVMQEALAFVLDFADDSDVQLALVHVESLANCAADWISRGAFAQARSLALRRGHAWREIDFPDEIVELADRLVLISKAHYAACGKAYEVDGPPGVLKPHGRVDAFELTASQVQSAASKGALPRWRA